MISRTLYLIVFLVVSLTAAADMGTVHCLEMTVTLSGGKTQRVFYTTFALSLERDEQGFYYHDSGKHMRLRSAGSSNYVLDVVPAEYHLFNHVKRSMADTIQVYDKAFHMMYVDQEGMPHPFMIRVGEGRKIASRTIREVTISRVYTLSPGEVIDTPLNREEAMWFSQAKIVRAESAGGYGNCGYVALFFQETTEQVRTVVQQLTLLNNKEPQSSDEYERIYPEIQRLLEKLKKEKVLIFSSCSC